MKIKKRTEARFTFPNTSQANLVRNKLIKQNGFGGLTVKGENEHVCISGTPEQIDEAEAICIGHAGTPYGTSVE